MSSWKKRREKRRRKAMAKQGLAAPFTEQPQSKPMPPLVRWNERTETYHLPDGSAVTSHCVLWKNNVYAVAVYDESRGITHVTVQRLDGTPARDWRHLQQIKNEVAGLEREAVELYPAQSRVVDMTNATHLWVMGEGETMPFGMFPLPIGVVGEWAMSTSHAEMETHARDRGGSAVYEGGPVSLASEGESNEQDHRHGG
jgi:hypothetical protein